MVGHIGRHHREADDWVVVRNWSFVGHIDVLVVPGSCPISCCVATWGQGGGGRGGCIFHEGRHWSGEHKAGFRGGVWYYQLDVCWEHHCHWDWDQYDVALDRGGGSCHVVEVVCHALSQGFWGMS